MFVAYLGLVLGLILIAYGAFSYTGSSALSGVPVLVRKGDVLWMAGILLLGIAALLGWVGFTFEADLRLWRIILAILGVLVGIAAWVIRPAR